MSTQPFILQTMIFWELNNIIIKLIMYNWRDYNVILFIEHRESDCKRLKISYKKNKMPIKNEEEWIILLTYFLISFILFDIWKDYSFDTSNIFYFDRYFFSNHQRSRDIFAMCCLDKPHEILCGIFTHSTVLPTKRWKCKSVRAACTSWQIS